MTAKRCPICDTGMLGFVAQPTIRDDTTIRVMATCTDCRYVFFHHFSFDDMLTEIFVMEDDDSDDTVICKKPSNLKKPPHLELVKSAQVISLPTRPSAV